MYSRLGPIPAGALRVARHCYVSTALRVRAAQDMLMVWTAGRSFARDRYAGTKQRIRAQGDSLRETEGQVSSVETRRAWREHSG